MSRGTRWSRSTSSAASLNSWLYSGARSATHSPQPTPPSVVVSPQQQHVLLVLHPERRAERAHQRQPAPQHLDRLDPHACLPMVVSGRHDVVALGRQPGDHAAGGEQRQQRPPGPPTARPVATAGAEPRSRTMSSGSATSRTPRSGGGR